MLYNNGMIFHVLSLLKFHHEVHAYPQHNDARYPLQRKSSKEKNTKSCEGKGWGFSWGHFEKEECEQTDNVGKRRDRIKPRYLVAKERDRRLCHSYIKRIIAD